MIIQIKGTELGDSCLIETNIKGTTEQLISLIVGAMHNNPPFAKIMSESYAQYLMDIGALNEE